MPLVPKLTRGSNVAMHPRTLIELSQDMVKGTVDVYQFSADFIKKRNKLFEEQLRVLRKYQAVDDDKQQDNLDQILKWHDKMIMDVAPGRKGCTSVFPWGGSIKVPPGLFGKKDNLIAKMISPCERHLHAPPLRDTEKLLSEVFLFVARNYEFDKLLTVEFPVYDENLELFEMRLKVKKSGDQDWITLDDYVYNAKTKMVTFETKSLGVFAVTSTPKAEKFDLTQNGCLYSARINRYISVRFPKRAVDRTVRCEIRIHKVTQEKIEITQRDHGSECCDVVAASNFYDISFPENEAMTFKRAASIKLPLALVGENEPITIQKQETETEIGEDGDHGEEEEVDHETERARHIDLENLCVLHKTEAEGWTLVETPLKYTRTTVQFDVKCLGKFVLVQTKTGLPKHRLKFAMPFIEEQNLKIKGEILTFLYKEKKHWRMMFDVVDKEYADIITQERQEAGWSFIEKMDLTEKPVEDLNNTRGYGRRRAPKEQKKEDPELKLLNLRNGSTYNIGITGDFKLAESTPDDRLVLQFHEKLTDNYTYFDLVPAPPVGWHWDKDKNKANVVIEKQNGEVNEKETKEDKENIENGLENGVAETKTFTGTISCFSNDSEEKRLLRKYNVPFSEEDFKEFLKPEFVEPEPEPEKPKAPSVVIVDPAKPSQPKPVKYKTFNSPQYTRLTKPSRPAIRISREAKVLSGRSLQVLSREVEQGLTLAVHLNLPDSTITGIGFDSLSNGMSLVDVTYKVLLHWKRLYKGDKGLQVEQLVTALKEMGRFDVAAVVMDRHRQGVELSSDCFKY